MSYPQIIGKVMRSFWALTEEKHAAIISLLEQRLAGAGPRLSEPQRLEADDPSGLETTDPVYFEAGDIAVIPIYGILGKHLSSIEMMCGGCSMDQVSKMLSVAGSSDRIRTIVLNIHSPGGTVTGTPELAAQIRALSSQREESYLRKRTIAFTDSECCSGALWLASQCDQFYATESAEIGSVGVRMILLDMSRALEEEGVKVNPIFSGKYKLAGAAFKPLEPDEREMFQGESDRIFAQFQEAVVYRRKVDAEYLQGQIFRGEEAARLGLIDGLVDDLDDLLEQLAPPIP